MADTTIEVIDPRKRFYSPSFAVNNYNSPVNFDYVHAIERWDDMGLKINQGRYQIAVYAANPHSKIPVTIWRFEEATGDHGRDAAFEKLKNIITTFI